MIISTRTLPSVYCTWSVNCFPAPFCNPAEGTSKARLNSRTALPVLGGTKLAEIVSTFFASFGGHLWQRRHHDDHGAVSGRTLWAWCEQMHRGCSKPHVSLTTTTNGPGVSGIVAVNRVVPVLLSVSVIVPLPPANTDTQSENCRDHSPPSRQITPNLAQGYVQW